MTSLFIKVILLLLFSLMFTCYVTNATGEFESKSKSDQIKSSVNKYDHHDSNDNNLKRINHKPKHDNHRHRHNHIVGCTTCPPGHYVKHMCNKTSDTICQRCPENTYLMHHSFKTKCELCSKCGDDLFIAHPCTSETDTICDSCQSRRRVPLPSDYYIKCQ